VIAIDDFAEEVAASFPKVKLRAEPWTLANGGGTWQACPCCVKRWRPFVGSRLPCHAKCLYTAEDKAKIRELYQASSITEKKLAELLGITPAMVRAVLGKAYP
jgi:hypothetical protein